jgi:hypothetical protein
MSAEDVLKKYNYDEIQPGIFFRAADTQVWQKVDGGWARFDPLTATGMSGKVWGLPPGNESNLILDGVEFVRVPYTVNELGEGLSGTNPDTHQGMYEWVWPEDVVEFQYKYASVGAPNKWVKTVDENGKVTMTEAG